MAEDFRTHPSTIEDGISLSPSGSEVLHDHKLQNLKSDEESVRSASVPFFKKLIAEMLGTYFLIFAGCAAIVVNLDEDNVLTLPGIALVWGLALMALVYTVGHISGSHVNPSVTIALATCGRFPWKQVPGYVSAQMLGSTVANGTLRLLFEENNKHWRHFFPVSAPSGSGLQSVVLEFIITFFLLFVICGVATDERATGELAGLAIGATVVLNILYAAPISGASMNPARSVGSAIVWNHYKGIWIYIVGPTCGAIAGAWAYNIIRLTAKPQPKITTTTSKRSFFKS